MNAPSMCGNHFRVDEWMFTRMLIPTRGTPVRERLSKNHGFERKTRYKWDNY